MALIDQCGRRVSLTHQNKKKKNKKKKRCLKKDSKGRMESNINLLLPYNRDIPNWLKTKALKRRNAIPSPGRNTPPNRNEALPSKGRTGGGVNLKRVSRGNTGIQDELRNKAGGGK